MIINKKQRRIRFISLSVPFAVFFLFLFFNVHSVWAEDVDSQISAGWEHTLGLKANGTVVATGRNLVGSCDVENWTDIISISAGAYHSLGLKSDGTVVAVGENDNGQCNVQVWKTIIQVDGGAYHSVGLRSDGRVVAAGANDYGQLAVSSWTDIIAVSAGAYHTAGLKSDGTVVAAGKNENGQLDIGDWSDISSIQCGDYFTLGLKSDGTVVAVGEYRNGECNVQSWTDIVAVAGGWLHTLGVKSDGTVVATGNNDYGQCNVQSWTDIVGVSGGDNHSVGLKSDGTVVAIGGNEYGQTDVESWSLESETSETPEAPEAPTQYNPSGNTSSTTFSWSTSAGATGYSIWICDTAFTGVYFMYYTASDVQNGTSCYAYVNPAYFTQGQTYYWFVAASNAVGETWNWDTGGTSFTIGSASTAPEIPTPYAPSGSISDTTFSWSASSNATTYSIWICDASYTGVYYMVYDASTVVSGNICSTYVDPAYFTQGQTYYWFVGASNDVGDAWNWNTGGLSFTIAGSTATAPEIPTQYAPSGSTSSSTFSWSASDGATSYSIWICDAALTGVYFNTYSAQDVETSGTCYTTIVSSTFTPGTNYYWYICASNSAGDSWSWNYGGMLFSILEEDDVDH